MSWYRTRVEGDLAKWQSAGWVTEAGVAAIKADLASRRPTIGAATIFAVLGAILFGFAVMSLANWNAMSKLARLSLLLAALWACYGGAAYVFARRLEAFAHSAVLGGIAVYGAGIKLVAQMYHMHGNPPDADLLWALGALLAAVLARSRAALAAALVLLSSWARLERELSADPHWIFLAPWVAAIAVAASLRWRPGLHLAALSLLTWLVPLGYYALDNHAHWVVVVIGGGIALTGAGLTVPAIERRVGVSQAVIAYGLAVAFAGLYIMQFVDDIALFGPRDAQPLGQVAALAAVTLILLVGAMYLALATDNRGLLWLAFAAFALQIFSLYSRMVGTQLETSLFFLVAALFAGVLAWAAYRLHLRQARASEASA